MSPKAAPNDEPIDTTADDSSVPAIPDAQPPSLVDGDWGSIDAGDYAPPGSRGRIPYYRLDRRLGEGFTDDETGEKGIAQLDFVWLAKAATRAWWPVPYGKGGEKFPTCRSADALRPDPASPEVQHEVCTTCSHNWRNRSRDAEDQQCRESVEALVFLATSDDVSVGRLAIIRFGGLAWSTALDYWSGFDRHMPKRPPLSVVTRCILEPTETQYDSKVLGARFERVKGLDFDQALVMQKLRDEHKAEFLGRVAEEVAEREADENGTTTEASPAETVTDSAGEPF